MKTRFIIILFVILLVCCSIIAMSACSETYSDVCEHAWDEGKVTVEAECERAGLKTLTCTICGETKYEAIPATGHTPVPTGVTVAADCLHNGNSYGVKCSVCNKVLEADIEVTALGHDYSVYVSNTATCVDDGKIITKCSRCESTQETYVAALGHSYGDWTITIQATCSAAGRKKRVCSRCVDGTEGHEEIATIARTAHAYVANVCSECGNEITAEEILAELFALDNGETLAGTYRLAGVICYVGDYDVASDSVNVNIRVGERELLCYNMLNSKDVEIDMSTLAVGDTITILGKLERHSNAYGFAANCALEAIARAECEHEYASSVTAQPTCIEKGVETYVCSKCGASYAEELPIDSSNHVVDVATAKWRNNGENHIKICNCGTVLDSSDFHSFVGEVCSICGARDVESHTVTFSLPDGLAVTPNDKDKALLFDKVIVEADDMGNIVLRFTIVADGWVINEVKMTVRGVVTVLEAFDGVYSTGELESDAVISISAAPITDNKDVDNVGQIA